MMTFYKRKVKISDFQKVIDEGQPNLEFLLDEKISFQVFLTQNIEDIGFYESDEKKKNIGDFNISDFIEK
jgi:hypothetical protein